MVTSFSQDLFLCCDVLYIEKLLHDIFYAMIQKKNPMKIIMSITVYMIYNAVIKHLELICGRRIKEFGTLG